MLVACTVILRAQGRGADGGFPGAEHGVPHDKRKRLLMDLSTSTAVVFWRPGHGAFHHGFASPDPDARAGYARQAADAAARILWTETWTNSPALRDAPRVDVQAGTADLVGQALEIAEARRDAAAWDASGFGPGGGRPVIVLVLDLPDGPGDQRAGIYELLRTGRHLGISVILVLPSLALEVIDSASRQLLAGGGTDHSPAVKAAGPPD